MKQYDVCSTSGPGIAGGARLVLVLQHRLLSDLDTVVVAPLFRASELDAVRQLRPTVSIEAGDYVIAIDRMASLPRRLLGKAVANLSPMDYEIRKALDLIFSGF